MNFTADYANDLLRDLENDFRLKGLSIDGIYSDPDFIDECREELAKKWTEFWQSNAIALRFLIQRDNRVNEVTNLKRCRGAMEKTVYRRLMNSATRRRRKTTQRFEHAREHCAGLSARIKELEVLRHAQASGLRRFWDHRDCSIENLSDEHFLMATAITQVLAQHISSKIAA